MANSVYLIHYAGTQDVGAAAIVFLNGNINGVDIGGLEYTGTYSLNDTGITKIQIQLNVPAGVELVTGAPALATPYVIPIDFSVQLPKNVSEVISTRIETPTGPVNLNIRKVRDISA